MVVMSLSLIFKPNGGKNKADPNGTAVRFTANLPGDEKAWRSKHARRVLVPSPKFCKMMLSFVIAKQKQVSMTLYGLLREYIPLGIHCPIRSPLPQSAIIPTYHPANHPPIHSPMHQRQFEASVAKAASIATKKRGGSLAAMQSKGKDSQLLENLLALDVWTRQSLSVRKLIAKKCSRDLMHAVSDYIGNDEPLLLSICPELREEKICEDGALARWARGQLTNSIPTRTSHSPSAIRHRLPFTIRPPNPNSRLVTECRRKDLTKVAMPTSVAFGEVQSAIKGHTRTIKSKSDRELVESFLVSFRSLSILTFGGLPLTPAGPKLQQ